MTKNQMELSDIMDDLQKDEIKFFIGMFVVFALIELFFVILEKIVR